MEDEPCDPIITPRLGGPRPGSHQCDTPVRTRVLTLVETGLSPWEVPQRTGVQDRSRPGRPPTRSKHDILRLIALLRSGWEGRVLEQVGNSGVGCVGKDD